MERIGSPTLAGTSYTILLTYLLTYLLDTIEFGAVFSTTAIDTVSLFVSYTLCPQKNM